MPSDDPISRLQFARDEVGTGYPHHFIKTSSASASSCSAPRRRASSPPVRHGAPRESRMLAVDRAGCQAVEARGVRAA